MFGSPAPTFSWSRNGVPIPGAIQSELRVGPVSEADYGEYECIISNRLGTITTSPAVLRRFPTAPVVVKQPGTTSVGRGEDLVLSVEGSSAVELGLFHRLLFVC